ncbi:hypothetical protein [Mesobacillus subterraneus]|uniref:DUF1538 domain-containing protein n=1 Tax=Mesobacillus subterraneus TaxID=285983 RepID=A0A0D6ZA55_9BACI|nr:hypothetical protein [Mesobacillus subterraneus]KIY21468.1 hypothetical protein UB32_13650 [Mesobacillus subterraneus]
MSLKNYAILLKILGPAVFLVPIFLKGMGYIKSISPAIMFSLIAIGVVLLIAGNICEAKAIRSGEYRRWRRRIK